MSKKVSTLLKFLLFFGIGILLIWLSVRGFTEKDKTDFYDAFHRADYTWIILSIVVGMFSHLIRAIRWKMLMEPIGYKPKTSNAFFAVMVAYLANYAIPRLGEVSRCEVLRRYEKIPFAESFGTVIVERIVDTLCFFILVVLVFFLQFDQIWHYLNDRFFPGLSQKFDNYRTLFYIIAAISGFGLLLLIILRRRIFGMMNEKTRKLWNGFKEGLSAIKRLRSPWLFVFHSFFIWFIYYAMLHLCFLCLGETSDLGVRCALTTLLFGTLTVIVTPGGLGAYPLAVGALLFFIYGVDESVGKAVGWLVWSSQFIAIVIFGSVSLVLLPILNKEK